MDGKTDIQCPACKTVFKIDIDKIPEKGCHANCKKCKNRFLVSRPPQSTGAPVSAAAQKGAPISSARPLKKKSPVISTAGKKAAPAVGTPAKTTNPVSTAKSGKKMNFLLIAWAASLTMLICIGAAFFLMQKYNFQITEKDIDTSAYNEDTPNSIKPSADSQSPVAASVDNENNAPVINTSGNIGDLFNRVNPAVATVLTYDSGNNPFRQGSGFFISQDGDFITNYHVLKGAYSVVIKIHNEIEYKAEFVLAADGKKDLIKLAVKIPGGALEPGAWLDINATPPDIADRIIVIGTPMGLGRTVSDGIISAIREIPDRGLAFQMTAPISRGSSGSPVIDMDGKVVGVAFFQIVNGQNLNFAIPAENILSLEDKRPLTIAAWTEEISREKNDNLDSLQKEIVKHIKQEKTDEKVEEAMPARPTNEVLKAKLASDIIQESGIAKQTNSLTEMALASFEEKYKNAAVKKIRTNDQQLSIFKDVIRLATNPARIDEYIKANLDSNLTIPELQQVLKWYRTPLGKKISEIEYSSYADKKEHVNTLRLAFNLTRYQSTSRANLFTRLDEATTSTEAMVELQTNLIVQNQILDLILSESKKLDQASIDEIIKNFETEIDPYLDIFAAQYVFAGFVYTYRGLSEAELEAYLSFSETEAGRHYYSLLKKKSNNVLLDCNKRILTSIIRVMNNDSWDNIQKDLIEPIKDT